MKITYDESGNPLFDGVSADEYTPFNVNNTDIEEEDNTNQDETLNTKAETQTDEEEPKQTKKGTRIYLGDEDITDYKIPEEPKKDFWGEVKEAKELRNAPALNSIVDAYRAVGFEAMKPFMRAKKYEGNLEGLNNLPQEEDYKYQAQTQFGALVQLGFRYTYPMIIGGIIGGIGKLTGIKNLQTIGEVVGGRTGFTNSKVANIMVNNGLIDGATAFMVTRPEEGEGMLGDLLPDSNNPIVQYFQTDTNDSGLEYRIKQAVQAAAIGSGLGVVAHGLTNLHIGKLNKTKQLANTKNVQEANKLTKDIAVDDAKINNTVKSQTLINNIQQSISLAEELGEKDVEGFILRSDFITNDNKALVKEIYDHIQAGREPIGNVDGTYTIKVNKWQDVAYISEDELKAQTNNDGISLMNEAVKDTWAERGWLAEGESIINTDVKTGKQTVNTKAVKRIKDNYINKWKIDNKIDIEFVDGKINGADATTQTLEYKGKVVKDKQNAIDKKQLQIKELEDKITMLQGGNKEISDPLDVLKEKLRIAKQELKELAKPNKLANIKILINKNAEDVEAILRSELEHTRDIAKETVPKDTTKHFSRYNGMNESEASLDYIRHKALNRQDKAEFEKFLSEIEETKKSISPEDAKYTTETNLKEVNRKYNFEDKVQTINGKNYDSIIVTNKAGEKVADVTYTLIGNEDIFVNMFTRYSTTKGEGRTAIVALMQKYPDRTIFWEAINKESVDSYKHFIKEYPELANKIDFQNRIDYKDVDIIADNSYNKEKGVINGEGSNQSKIGEGSRSSLQNESRNINSRSSTEMGAEIKSNQPKNNISGELSESLSRTNERGEATPNINNRPISERQQQLKSIEEANQLLEDDIKANGRPDKRDWKVNLDNAEDIYARFYERGIENTAGLKEAISAGDVEYVNMVVEKQLAAERRMSDLKETLLKLPETAYKQRDDIINSIFQLQAVSKELAAAYGRGLNAQKLVKRVNNIFQLSTMQEMGIEKMADLLSVDIKNLNFTRGTEAAKQQLYKALSNDKRYGKLLQDIFKEAETKASFDNLLDNIVKQRITNPEELQSALRSFADPYIRRDIIQMLNYCTDEKLIGKIVSNAKASNSSRRIIGDYIVNNLLSNPKTTIMNVLSGVLNTAYFPFIKILGGKLGGGEALSKEGAYQLVSLGTTLRDAWKMGVQAFKTGEGRMINLSRSVPTELDADKYKAFFKWQFNTPKEAIHNLWTLMSRTMGASDEFLTQMNYRANVRAKALIQAEEIAKVCGKLDDSEFIKEQVAKYFNEAFDTQGRPLDVQAYAEARDIVYQTPLSGKYWDFKTQSYTKIKEQSLLMKTGEAFTKLTMDIPEFKGIFPFIRTPLNIGQMSLEHNGLYNLLSPSQRKIFLSNTPEGAKARAKVALGMMSEAVAWTWAATGGITGSPPADKKERAALYKTGWRPYSIKAGDKYYSYAAIEPLCTILGFAADMHYIYTNYTNDDNPDLVSYGREALKAFYEATLDKASFTNGINQYETVINFLEGTDNTKGEQLLKMLKPFLPLDAAIESYSTLGKNEATTPKGYQAIFNKYFNRGLGDYKRNVFGERQDVYNYALVTATQGLKKDLPEDEEMMRLAESGWSPTELTAYESNSTVKYKEFINPETGRSIYDALNEEMTQIKLNNKTLREAVRQLVTSSAYQTAVDGTDGIWKNQKGTKVFMLRQIFNNYKKAAKAKTLREQGQNFVNKDGLNAFGQRQKDIQDREAERLKASIEQSLQDIRSFS